ncbi:hypothetical protein U1Q18_012223 [Sarracenia purpurea var. burkii]
MERRSEDAIDRAGLVVFVYLFCVAELPVQAGNSDRKGSGIKIKIEHADSDLKDDGYEVAAGGG